MTGGGSILILDHLECTRMRRSTYEGAPVALFCTTADLILMRSRIRTYVYVPFPYYNRFMVRTDTVPLPIFTVPILYQKTVEALLIRPTVRFFPRVKLKRTSHGVQLLREAKHRVLPC